MCRICNLSSSIATIVKFDVLSLGPVMISKNWVPWAGDVLPRLTRRSHGRLRTLKLDDPTMSFWRALILINVFECSFETDISLILNSIKVEIISQCNNVFWIINSACSFHTSGNIFLIRASRTGRSYSVRSNSPLPELDLC